MDAATRKRFRGSAIAAIITPLLALIWRAQDDSLRTRNATQLQSVLERALLSPLQGNQGASSMHEYDVMTHLSRQPGVSEVLYLNQYSEVRWHRDMGQLTSDLSHFSEKYPVPNSLIDAHTARLPTIQRLPGEISYAIALPLLESNEVRGLVFLKAEASAIAALLQQADRLFPQPMPRPAHQCRVSDESFRSSAQHYLSGLVYYGNGELRKAKDEWRLALLLDPDNFDASEGFNRIKGG